jgi:DNA-binding NtrC family response regulator
VTTRLIARSPAMRELIQQVRRFAQADANVLITGETGAGKDAVAAALHSGGPRRSHPFVKIDCASMPAGLIEAELFGYEKGAFTDAAVAKAGRFELAGRGTVYLDAVSELPLDLQSKLLRLVEDKRVERLGGVAPLDLRARIVASAGAGVEAAVRDGAFRDDLFHRLSVLPLHVPALRQRRQDIIPLAEHFLDSAARQYRRSQLTLTPAARAVLEEHRWPGNVRELRHVVERTVVGLDPERVEIDAADLPMEVLGDAEAIASTDGADRPTLEALERLYITRLLRETRGNQTETARILGISRKALWEKRKKYGLE